MDMRTGEIEEINAENAKEMMKGYHTPFVGPTPQKPKLPYSNEHDMKKEIALKITELELQGKKPLSRNVRRKLIREVLKRKKKDI